MVYFTTLYLSAVLRLRVCDDGMNKQNLEVNSCELIEIILRRLSKGTEGKTRKPSLGQLVIRRMLESRITRKMVYSITATEMSVVTVILFC